MLQKNKIDYINICVPNLGQNRLFPVFSRYYFVFLTIFMMNSYYYYSQEKCIEYFHCFHDVNEMGYIIITIVNIPLVLYLVFIGNVYIMDLLQL